MLRKLVFSLLFIFLLTYFIPSANALVIISTDSARSNLKEQRLDTRQQIKDTVQAKREELKEIVKTRRDEFLQKLESIKDEKKKLLVERIDVKLAEINTKHTDRFIEVLSKLQEFLDNFSQGIIEEKVLEAIETAQAAIDKAKAAVEDQAAKTYTIQITSETVLRSKAGTTASQLRKDLMAAHKAVVDAKQAVQSLRANKVMMEKEATRSANL